MRKWRGDRERMKKWRERKRGKRERKWRENKKMKRK